MKKGLNYTLSVVLIFAVALGFATQNNFGFDPFGTQKEKEVSLEEVQKRIVEKIVAPIRSAFEETNPHMFMMKCYSDVTFDIHDLHLDDEKLKNIKFYESSVVEGRVHLIYCDETDQVCRYRLSLNDNSIQIKESYKSGWGTLENLVKNIKSSPVE